MTFSAFHLSQKLAPTLALLAANVKRLHPLAFLLFLTPLALAQPASPALPLHTSGAHIVDSSGTPVHLHAVNWYGAESSDFVVAGLQSQPLAAITAQIRGLGFNTVRIPLSNQLVESNPVVGNYALAANPALQGQSALAILDQVIASLTSAGIMVILDNHGSDAQWCCSNTDDNTLWYNSRYPESAWLADWQTLATRYVANPLVIGADLRNEPRNTASWGGDPSTDWHAAAQRGGNAIQAIAPNWLIFVEGVNYALDLSGAQSLPIQLNTPNQLVYSAHDYGFDYSNLTGYTDYVNRITPKWAYLLTASSPTPVWLGEFGTCNNANICVTSGSSADGGYWFGFLATFIQANNLDWSYWAVNGTQSTGSGRTYGAQEAYGILNTSWTAPALPALTASLATLSGTTSPNFSLATSGTVAIAHPGLGGNATLTLTPHAAFSGTVNLSCTLTGIPVNAQNLPACSLPATLPVSGTSTATVSITTSGSGTASNRRHPLPWRPAAGAALACLLFALPRRSRRLFAVLLLAALTLTATSCSSGGDAHSIPPPVPSTTAGTYTFTILANSSSTDYGQTQLSVTVP